MRPRTIRTVIDTIALLCAVGAATPRAALANAVPSISALSPATLPAGGGGFTLTIAGGGFDSSSQVKFDEDVLTPASITPTQIAVAVPAADIASGGYVAVTVTTASGASQFKLFTVENTAPQIFGMSPIFAFSGGNFFTLTLTGSGFNAQTQVVFGPDLLTPDTVTPTQLTVTVPAGEIVDAGAVTVSTVNPDPVAGSSNTQTFTVVTPYPIVTSVSPNTILAGSTDTAITITGLNFTSNSVAQWNGAALTTSFVSAKSLTATIPAADLAAATTAAVTVTDPNYGLSAAFPFTVTARTPVAASLSPSSANSGDPSFTLTVSGTDFQAGSIVYWNSAPLPTTFVSPTQLTVTVAAAFLASPGSIPVVVTTPVNGRTVITSALFFTINPSAPVLTSLSPSSQAAGGPPFLLIVNGSKFLRGVAINWNGVPLPTGIFSSSVLTTQISADKIAAVGTAVITLTNPGASAPSSPLNFQITTHPVPRITTLTPNTVVAGAPDTTISITGSNFTSASVVQWNGTALSTTDVGANSLQAIVPAANLAAATTAAITVSDPAYGLSDPAAFTVTAQAPTTASLSPSSANNGDPGFTLTVNGANFQAGSLITWNGAPLPTTFVSASQLTATVAAAQIASPGAIPVAVSTPMGNQTASTTPLTFTINPSAPVITSLSPATKVAGSPAFLLIVNGAKFLKGVAINWNGVPLPTGVFSSTVLTAQISADKVAAAGTAVVTLTNPGASATSSPLTFQITPHPAPMILTLNPNTVVAGASDTVVTITGANFTNGSVVQWNGTPLTTNFVSGAALTATIPAADLSAATTAALTVSDPSYGLSNAAAFTVTNPIPTADSLSPNLASNGDPDLTLTVNGANFQSGSVIKWNGAPLPTTFVSATQLTATVRAALLASPGAIPVAVSTPMGNQTASTAPLTFTINPSAPVITSLSPATKVAGSPAFLLIVNGAKFLKGVAINWNGVPLPTGVFSSSVLTAQISADKVAAAGTAVVTLTNVGASGSSSALTFQITPHPAPMIFSLAPNTAVAGALDTIVNVKGVNFTSGSAVQWNGQNLVTTFVTGTSLQATIPAADLASATTAAVTVSDPSYGLSNAAAFTVTVQAPTAAALSPSSANNGDPDLTLTVSGANFQSGSVIKWNGAPLPTTFVSATQLTATVRAALLASPGAIPVAVSTPMGNQTSTTAPLTFTINPSAPVITSLSPATKVAGSPAFLLIVNGAKFLKGVAINWNGVPLPTGVFSSSVLTAQISADKVAAAGTAVVTLTNVGASASSSALTFQITPHPAPMILSVAPNTAVAGASDTIVTITGANFTNGSVVQWNGIPLATGYVSGAALTATIPAADLSAATTAALTVSDPSYGLSNAAAFTVTVQAPTAAALSPSSANNGDPDLTLTVSGANFQSGSVIKWNGAPLPTTFVSATQLTATVRAALLASPGAIPVVVATPMGNQTASTAPLTFTINPSAPVITSLSPATKVAGSPAFLLIVNGAKFLKGVAINWNGVPLPTGVFSSSVLTAQISADKVAAAGTAVVTLTNPGASATSSPLTFQITPHPAPMILTLNPNTVVAGASDTVVTITGANFTNGSVVQWNGIPLATGFVSATSLTATIPAADLAAATTAAVTVTDPSYGPSAAVPFTVTARTPVAASLSPSSASSGDAGFTLTVNGANFQAGSVVTWGGSALSTTFVSSSRLTAAVPASCIAGAASVSVTVRTPMSGASAITAALAFTVSAAAPVLTSLSPATKAAGSASFLLIVSGAKLTRSVVINWNGVPLPTGIFSSTVLTAQISADKIASAGTAVVTLTNPGAKAPSNALSFQITAAAQSSKK